MLACWHGCRKAVRSSMMSGRGVLLGYPSTWGWFGAHQTHENSPQTQVLVHHWLGAWINGWDCSLRESGKQENPTLIFTRCWPSLLWGREQNTHNTTREKRERRRRSKSVQIWWLWTDLLQISDWRLKRAWIWAKLGEIILHLECFDLVSWGLAKQSIRFDRGFVSSGDCSFITKQFR